MTERKNTGAVFAVKWVAAMIQICGYAATGFGFVPWNSYMFIAGLSCWFAVGVMWNDRAIMLINIVALASLVTGLLSV